MTIKQKLTALLVEHGLFESQATAVMESVIARDIEFKGGMHERWHHDISGYDSNMILVLWIGVRAAAVTWIDKYKPLHWARGMFVDFVDPKTDTISPGLYNV